MTIKELVERKKILETQMTKLVEDFQDETGTWVTNIEETPWRYVDDIGGESGEYCRASFEGVTVEVRVSGVVFD